MEGIVRPFSWSYFVQGKVSYLAFVNLLSMGIFCYRRLYGLKMSMTSR